MITSGIDIGKNSHVISVIDQDTGVLLVKPTSFTNNFEGFKKLDKILEPYSEKNLRVGMEDTDTITSIFSIIFLKKDTARISLTLQRQMQKES